MTRFWLLCLMALSPLSIHTFLVGYVYIAPLLAPSLGLRCDQYAGTGVFIINCCPLGAWSDLFSLGKMEHLNFSICSVYNLPILHVNFDIGKWDPGNFCYLYMVGQFVACGKRFKTQKSSPCLAFCLTGAISLCLSSVLTVRG